MVHPIPPPHAIKAKGQSLSPTVNRGEPVVSPLVRKAPPKTAPEPSDKSGIFTGEAVPPALSLAGATPPGVLTASRTTFVL